MSPFTQVSLRNGAAFVTSLTVEATAQGQPWQVKSGNFGAGNTHTVQVPDDAVGITVEVRGERAINDWKTVFKQTYPNTTSWPAGGLRLSASGTTFDMHCKVDQASGQPA